MKKLTAIILSVIMLFGAIPLTSFATENTVIMIDDAKDFAKMTDTRSYILTQNIDLGSDFETIESFGGTLDGNGYTVTVPTNAPIFEVISGTVKNLNLTGTVLLEDDDLSRYYLSEGASEYALGVLSNIAIGATINNVHSDVNVKYTQTNGKNRVVFGGMIGAAFPYYVYEEPYLEVIKKTTVDRCFVGGSISADYIEQESVNQMDSVGGLIALATCDVDISNSQVSADITVHNASGFVAGILAVQYALRTPSLVEDGSLDHSVISNIATALAVTEVTNCLVTGSLSRTANSRVEKIGGIVGFANYLDMKACAYTGDKLEDVNGKERTILAYGDIGNFSWCYIKINSCVATLGEKIMIYVYKNTKSFENVIVWGSGSNTVVYNTGNDLGIKRVDGGQEAALQTFAEANSSAFSYDDSNKTLSLDTITKPSPDCTHKCTVSTGEDYCLSTGTCNCQNDCVNYITGDPYAGFVQFNNDGTRLRIIMVVSDEELTDTKELKPMELRVTIENQSVSIRSAEFTAYESVSAQGKEYVARDGYYLFGAVFEFAVDMSSASPVVTVTYDGANEPVFMGSVKRSNE